MHVSQNIFMKLTRKLEFPAFRILQETYSWNVTRKLEFPCMYPTRNVFMKFYKKAWVSCISMYVSCREYNHEMLYKTWNFLHAHACILQGIIYKSSCPNVTFPRVKWTQYQGIQMYTYCLHNQCWIRVKMIMMVGSCIRVSSLVPLKLKLQ